jgi:hypothetical protein
VSRQLVFHPDVEDEVREAYRWYESRRSGLGDDFLVALEKVYGLLRVTPEMHQVIEQNVRRSLPPPISLRGLLRGSGRPSRCDRRAALPSRPG